MATLQNQSALFYAPQDVRFENFPLPDLQPGEVLVRIGAALTCGTDKKTYQRGHPVIIKNIPSPFGHEMAGTVVEVGPSVTQFQKNDRVVIANSAPCLKCFFCQKNKANLCENLLFLNGAFSQYLIVPAQIVSLNLYHIKETTSFAKAALAEPLACVLHAADQIGIQKNDIIAIVGTGPMAFLFMQVIAECGAKAVMIGRQQHRLDLAKKYGIFAVIHSQQQNMAEEVKKLTAGYGVDVAIEAVGQPEIWQQTVGLVRKGGKVCLYGGSPRGTTFHLDTYRVHYDEISVSGVFHHTPAFFKQAVSWLENDKIKTDLFLNETRNLTDLIRIFSGEDTPTALKFIIEPN